MTNMTEGRLLPVLKAQRGLVTLEQVNQLGVSHRYVYSRLQHGVWSKIYKGVYKAGQVQGDLDEREIAALLVCGPTAVLSHSSSARRLGLDAPPPNRIQLTLPIGLNGPRNHDLEIHRSRLLSSNDVRVLGALRYFKLGRTLFDLAGSMDEMSLRIAIDSALRKHRSNLAWLKRFVHRFGEGRPGAAILRRLLGEYDVSTEIPDSALERMALELIKPMDGARPILHHVVRDGERHIAEIDFAWPTLRIGVELDGWAHHSSRRAFMEDRRRDRELMAMGWVVLRFTWDDVAHHRATVLDQLREALQAARETRFAGLTANIANGIQPVQQEISWPVRNAA